MNWNSTNLFSFKFAACLFILVCHSFYNPTDSGAVQITQSNLDMVLASNEIVFINFYADWCKFSNMLMPIFDEAADEVTKVGYDTGKVVMGKVDCDKEAAIATRFHITKYPTLKLFQNGLPAKKEYRGQRSVEAFAEFIKKQLVDPIKVFGTLKELLEISDEKRHIIGYMDRRDQLEYQTLRRVAGTLKDECIFHAGFGDASEQMHPPDPLKMSKGVVRGMYKYIFDTCPHLAEVSIPYVAGCKPIAAYKNTNWFPHNVFLHRSELLFKQGQPIVVFRADKKTSTEPDETYTGSITNFDDLHKWVQQKCIPLVREITFENAEELTEEGLPFLILFHHPDDTESVKKYKELISRDLESEKQNINFLTADGKRFEHPLHHLGKSTADLPLIAIDSFRHMYLFPDYKDMEIPGRLKQFLQDLYSGKLHREFHSGPDPNQIEQKSDFKVTTPPESTFKHLAPSKNRYTLLRDEL